MPQNINLALLAGGYKGRFYIGGVQVGYCQDWSCTANVKTSTDQALDQLNTVETMESASYALTFQDIAVTSDVPNMILADLLDEIPPVFGFQGSRLTLDGQEEHTNMASGLFKGDIPLSGAKAGTKFKRKYTVALNVPAVFGGTIQGGGP